MKNTIRPVSLPSPSRAFESRWPRMLGASLLLSFGCTGSDPSEEHPIEAISALTSSELRQRCDSVKARAARAGLTNALIIAGIAQHETGMAQCYSEYASVACDNVGRSADCPLASGVLGGGGDGACSLHQGGIGMYQLDRGTHAQTLAYYGDTILNVNGNIDAGVEFVIDRLGFHCPITPTFADRAAAIAWFNSATPGTAAYETFMHALAECYNGCRRGYTTCGGGSLTHDQMAARYRSATEYLRTTLGNEYWYPTTGSNSCQYRCSDYGYARGQCYNGWGCDCAGECITRGCTTNATCGTTGGTTCQYRCSDYRFSPGQCYSNWRCDCSGQCLTQGCTTNASCGTTGSSCQYRCSDYRFSPGQCYMGWLCDCSGQCLTQGCSVNATCT